MQASALEFFVPEPAEATESARDVRRDFAFPDEPAVLLRVLIVIPTLNEGAHIDALLSSLLDEPPRTANLRVVVVDGGSSDETLLRVQAAASRYPELCLLYNPQRIQSAGLNLAARRFGSEADVLIRCDAHAVYPPRFCERLIATLLGQDADAVVIPLDSVGQGWLQRAVAWVSNSIVGSGGSAHRAGHTSGFVEHGHHAAFRVDSFRRAGGYDETFTHNEDAEFDCRQRALGGRIFLDSEIRCRYHPRSGLGALFRQYFRYGVGRSRTARRHSGSLKLRQLLVPANLLLVLLGLALSPLSRGFLLWPALYVAVLFGTSLELALRHRAWCGLLAGPAAAVMHTAWACGFLFGLLTERERAWRTQMAQPLWDEPASGRMPAEPAWEEPASGCARIPSRRLHALLVDPSLFTEPYDAGLSEGLVGSGVRPTWAVRPTRRGDRPLLAPEQVDAFFYKHVDDSGALPRPLRALAKGFSHLVGLARLIRRVRAARPDVVHFQWSVLPLLDTLAIAAIRRTCPVVITVHDTIQFNGDRHSPLQVLASDLPLRLAERVIVHTRAGQETLLQRNVPQNKLAVVPHGPLTLATPAKNRVHSRTDARFTFVLFGELKHYKGIDVLLDAVARLEESTRERARFIIAGRPRMDLAPTVAQIAGLGLERHVEVWPRRLSEQEMADLFAGADCFLFPYRQIDASGAYFLLKGLGKWIIASKVGIFSEDVRDGVHGTLVEPEDPSSLAQAIAQAIAERPQPLERSADVSWAAIGNATRELYEQVIADRGARS